MDSSFLILAATLLGIAFFHRKSLLIAFAGLTFTLILKGWQGFDLVHHFKSESVLLINLIGLILGFSIIAELFSQTKIPQLLPRYLPKGWLGPFLLLVFVYTISTFLDNIAAALIGGTIAFSLFKGRVHLGYLIAITAASNAGGAGSVLGDTTTTMLWMDGVAAKNVSHAFIGSAIALFIFGIPASIKQIKLSPIDFSSNASLSGTASSTINWKYFLVIFVALIAGVAANVFWGFPALGVWGALILGNVLVTVPWRLLRTAASGALFLAALVSLASLMSVENLPPATWKSTFVLGFISSVFDNIPLTKLALSQKGYDWGVLAYAVGFGGSMLWFGSSAGVALSSKFEEMRSVKNWIQQGWLVIVAYVVGFFAILTFSGWNANY